MNLAPKAILGLLAACLCTFPAAAQAPCTGDLNADRVVDGNDLGVLLGAWGACGGSACPADLNADGFVNGDDLGVLLTAWGVCPVVVPDWATLIEALPDPAVITDAGLRQRIVATGWAWRVRDAATQIEMLLVPPGWFQMGCSASIGYSCEANELPVHPVSISRPFYLGRFEVTQAQWLTTMGSNPSSFQGPQFPNSGSRPVERVTWSSVHRFTAATGMRLPTEAEWEYACRAGTSTAFSHGSNSDNISAYAWTSINSSSQTQPVGLKLPNPLGFHDIHGNVWEWVNDWYSASYYQSSAEMDPPGPVSGVSRVARGGGWSNNQSFCRSSSRVDGYLGVLYINVGLRVARDPISPVRRPGVPWWATLVEFAPDPKVVPDARVRAAIDATGLAWRVLDTATSMEMLLVPPGLFDMGCSPSELYDCDADGRERPVHAVAITQAFYLGRFEVTQQQWKAQLGSNPSHHQGIQYPNSAVHPVERVTWMSIQNFTAETRMRLPTEAEWEYACRAGTETAFSNGSDDDGSVSAIAWFSGNNSPFATKPVGLKDANRFGFHDMHGNVWEWVNDLYSATYFQESPVEDPQGPASGSLRVIRGGYYGGDSRTLRSSYRHGLPPSSVVERTNGFRAARTP